MTPDPDALRSVLADVRARHAPNEYDQCVADHEMWPCAAELLAEFVVTQSALAGSDPAAGLRERVEAIDIEQFYDDSGSDAFNHVAYRDAVIAALAGSEPAGLRYGPWTKPYHGGFCDHYATSSDGLLCERCGALRAALAATPTASPTATGERGG